MNIFINKDDYMKQTNNLKTIAGMVICVVGNFIVTSCSNDDFLDNWDDPLYKIHESFYDISESIEYQQYLEKLFVFNNAIVNPDTSKAVAIYKKDSLIVYVNSLEDPSRALKEAEERLNNKFPSYHSMGAELQEELLLYRINNDSYLRQLSGIKKKKFIRSKAWNPEMTVARYSTTTTTFAGTQWIVEDTNSSLFLGKCRSYSVSTGIESGGYVFNGDGSALFIKDTQATSNYIDNGDGTVRKEMSMPVWNWPDDAKPRFGYHCHPDESNEGITISSYDWNCLAVKKSYGCNTELIIGAEGDYTWSLWYPGEVH